MTQRDERLKEIAERAEKATPGAWKIRHPLSPIIDCALGGAAICRVYVSQMTEANGGFIAHSRSDIPWLLSELSAADAENTKLRAIANISDRIELIDALEAERERNRAENAKLRERLRVMEEALKLWLTYDNCDEADFAQAGPMLLYARAINATRAALAGEEKCGS